MFKPGALTGNTRWHRRVAALITKVIAVAGLLALGFLLTRAAAATFPVGWVLLVVAIIEVSLGYSPAKETTSTDRAFAQHPTECRRYPSREKSPYLLPKTKEN